MTILYHFAVVKVEIIPPAVALLWPFVVLAGFAGGIRSGLLAAAWVSGYAFYSLAPTGEIPRAIIITIGTFISAFLVGYRTRLWRLAMANLEASIKAEKKARLAAEYNQQARNFVDKLNGNIELLNATINRISDLIRDWSDLHNDARKERLVMIRHDLIQLLTAAEGWLQLAWIKELITTEGPEKGRIKGMDAGSEKSEPDAEGGE